VLSGGIHGNAGNSSSSSMMIVTQTLKQTLKQNHQMTVRLMVRQVGGLALLAGGTIFACEAPAGSDGYHAMAASGMLAALAHGLAAAFRPRAT
jgi:hypothetical protein